MKISKYTTLLVIIAMVSFFVIDLHFHLKNAYTQKLEATIYEMQYKAGPITCFFFFIFDVFK